MSTPVNIVCAECDYVFRDVRAVGFAPDECPQCASLRDKFGDTLLHVGFLRSANRQGHPLVLIVKRHHSDSVFRQ